jgi:hypothetical protein
MHAIASGELSESQDRPIVADWGGLAVPNDALCTLPERRAS